MADDSASSKGVSRSGNGAVGSGSTKTASGSVSKSSSGKAGGGAGGSGGQAAARNSSGSPTSKPGSSPGGGARDSGQAAARSAPAKTGSGQIGSKGGGASTQRPGAGGIKGPSKASSVSAPTSRLQSFTAGSNLAASRAQQMKAVSQASPKPPPGQGFIRDNTQALRQQYEQYRASRTAAPASPAPGMQLQNIPGLSAANPGQVPAGLTYRPPTNPVTMPLTGMQPTRPTLQQNIAGLPIGYTGPRAGTAMPPGMQAPGMQTDPVQMAHLGGIVDRAQAGTLLSNYGPPPAKEFADRVLGTTPPAGRPFARGASPDLPPGYASRYLDDVSVQPAGGVTSAPTPTVARPSVSPMQGENVPPSQLDRYPQSVRELRNRMSYAKDQAKQGVRDMPGRIGKAIREGDFRNPQGYGNFPTESGTRNLQGSAAPRQPAPSSFNDLVASLLRALDQQQGITSGSQDQMDLVYNTFV